MTALTALLVGGVGVSNAVRDFLSGKIQTIATLKCIGAPSGLIFGAYLIQIMIMAIAGIAIGLLIGGLAPRYAPYLPADTAAGLVEPKGRALDGALALAARFDAP